MTLPGLVRSARSRRAGQRNVFDAPGMRVRDVVFAPDSRLDDHAHPHGYLCLVVDGAFAETWVGRDAHAYPGTVYFLPAGARHTNRFFSAGAHCLRIEIDESLADALQATLADPWFRLGGPASWLALRLYRRCVGTDLTADDLESYLSVLFERGGPGSLAAYGSARRPRWITDVRDALIDAGSAPPTLTELSRIAGVHRASLTRAFFAEFGCSVGEFVLTRRVACACRLLIETPLPLSRIAVDVGFHDQAHFTRAFRRRIGVTPGVFRPLYR